MDHNQERRRGHFHRGRRGPDRRGPERRTPPPQEQAAGRDQVDVEQIMRDIRARIAQRPGLDLTTQQIQELAARRLEAVLDPRAMKPALLDELRKAAGAPAQQAVATPAVQAPYTYTEGTVYESHRGIVRFFRRLFKPLLMLVFNPTPIERALAAQAAFNTDAAQRDAERQRQQAEWNALHYEIVQRLVTDVARASLELQALSTRIESLAAKVDFNERRVRHMEGTMHQARPSGRPVESAVPAGTPAAAAPEGAAAAESSNEPAQAGEGTRRRRRRRRGRRGGGVPGEGVAVSAAAGTPVSGDAAAAMTDEDGEEADLGDEAGPEDAPLEDQGQSSAVIVSAAPAAPEPQPQPASEAPPSPEPPPATSPEPPETDRTE